MKQANLAIQMIDTLSKTAQDEIVIDEVIKSNNHFE